MNIKFGFWFKFTARSNLGTDNIKLKLIIYQDYRKTGSLTIFLRI